MNIFLSYATEDRPVAATLNRALMEQGHDVFFDREDLPAGEEFHIRIRRAIEESDLFVFLISDHSVNPGSYTLSELAIVERAWKRVSGRLLPVMLGTVPFDQLPPLVRAITVLTRPPPPTRCTACNASGGPACCDGSPPASPRSPCSRARRGMRSSRVSRVGRSVRTACR